MEDWCATVAEVSEQKLKLPLLTCVLQFSISQIPTIFTSLDHVLLIFRTVVSQKHL